MKVYPFVEAEQAGRGNVAMACRLLEVSRSAYYDRTTPSARSLSDAEPTKRIGALHAESRGTYGAPRVHAALRRDGVHVGRKRVARLVARAGLAGRCRRRFVTTTKRDPSNERDLVDLVRRRFEPGVGLDRCRVGDVTYVATDEGWLYLAVVLDLASRKVVGWSMADHLRTELVSGALGVALAARRPPPGVVFHADRGWPYTSADYAALAARHEVRLSFSRPGRCRDDAVAESFFATLEGELVDRQAWPTRAAARSAIFGFVEGWYNRRRLHSSLGYSSPAEYEAVHRSVHPKAA